MQVELVKSYSIIRVSFYEKYAKIGSDILENGQRCKL